MQISLQQEFSQSDTTADIFRAILNERGLTDPVAIKDFLRPIQPTLKYLLAHIDVDIAQLAHAKKLLHTAIVQGQDICIFGDYDADGITSTAVLWQTLQLLGEKSQARIMPFIPDRSRHGYGLSIRAVQDIMDGTAFADTSHPDFRPSLVVTVDNGIVAHDAVNLLKSNGVTVIITDHHQKATTLPDCHALVHSTATSGAGIAWLLSLYLSDEDEKVVDLVDIATIGVVADQMPLVGVNRTIVVSGLARLNHTHNLGLQTLMVTAGIGNKVISTYEINYVIAPRINAVGRLGNPIEALRLLCSKDKKQITEIAHNIEVHNTTRQQLTDTAIQAALAQPIGHNIAIVASPTYHEGIIGLIAGKLAENYHRPAIAISINEKFSKGSARSVGDIDVTAIMRQYQDLLLGVGGHKLAGGFSIDNAHLSEFTEKLYAYADSHLTATDLEKKTEVTGALNLDQITLKLAKLIAHLEPFGMGNPKPRFLVSNLQVIEDRKIGVNGRHRKLVVEQNGTTRDVIWFNGDSPHPIRSIQAMICTAEINVWRDRESLQLNASYVQTI